MIQKTNLETKSTSGAVGQPVFAGDTTIISTKTADMTNSESQINITASEEDRSAKWCYPNVSQDVPPLAGNQYQ